MPRTSASYRRLYPGKFGRYSRYGGWRETLASYSPTLSDIKRAYHTVTSPIRYAASSLSEMSRLRRRRAGIAAAKRAMDLRDSKAEYLRRRMIEYKRMVDDDIRQQKMDFYMALATHMQAHPEVWNAQRAIAGVPPIVPKSTTWNPDLSYNH